MANIGTFTKTAKGYAGEIVTMSVQQKKVRIEAETDVQNDKAPTHRVFVGRAEIGAGWAKQSNEGRDYLSLKLDDPSFAAPIYANLFDDEAGETFNLIWSRNRATNGACPSSDQPPSGSTGAGLMLPRSLDFLHAAP